MNGNHRPVGILFLSKSVVAGVAQIEDVAPTVLAALDVASPPMDGTSLLGPVALAADVTAAAAADSTYSTEQARAVEDRLRALGYFE